MARRVVEASAQLIGFWRDQNEILTKRDVSLDSSRNQLDGLSINIIEKKLYTLNELLNLCYSKADNYEDAILSSYEKDLLKELNDIIQFIKGGFLEKFDDLERYGSISFDNDGFEFLFYMNGNISGKINMGNYFNKIGEMIYNLLYHIGTLLPLVKLDGKEDLIERGKEYLELNKLLKNNIDEIDRKRKEIIDISNILESMKDRYDNVYNNLNSREKNVSEIEEKSRSGMERIGANIERVEVISLNAQSLHDKVLSYQSKFDLFQDNIERYVRDCDDISLKMNNIINKGEADLKEISELISLSDKMISGATDVGLGKYLEDVRSRYATRMKRAMIGFLCSIVILAVSSFPLSMHLFSSIFPDLFSPSEIKSDSNIWSIIGKVVIMVPPTWLTAFFAKSYSELFQLEREYAHKMALAGSVHGFKLQAPKYEEEITAEVFMEIRTNPARGVSVDPATHPLYDVLNKVVSKVLDIKKNEPKKDGEPNKESASK